jgi:two-component system phosphate regulon sensor histidine kinase PhoR
MDTIELVVVMYEISVAYVIGMHSQKSHEHTSVRKLKEIQESQNQMLVDIAHGVQSPLTVIYGEIEYLEHLESSRNFEIIKKSLNKLSACIQHILECARFEGCLKPTMFEVVNLSVLMEDQVEYFEVMAHEQGVNLKSEIQAGICIHGDRRLLVDMIVNIAHNAIKYHRTDCKSSVDLKLHCVDNTVELLCIDNGIGISKDDIAHIFTRFYRAQHSADREGFGIGLAVTKKIVEMHNGTVDVVSVKGEGTTFVIRFPLNTKKPPLWRR